MELSSPDNDATNRSPAHCQRFLILASPYTGCGPISIPNTFISVLSYLISHPLLNCISLYCSLTHPNNHLDIAQFAEPSHDLHRYPVRHGHHGIFSRWWRCIDRPIPHLPPFRSLVRRHRKLHCHPSFVFLLFLTSGVFCPYIPSYRALCSYRYRGNVCLFLRAYATGRNSRYRPHNFPALPFLAAMTVP